MKTRDNIMRLKRFYMEEKRRRVMQIEAMVAEFLHMAEDLAQEIAAEEHKAGVSDPDHFAYPTYARAARTRRDNLLRSAEELNHQLIEARQSLAEALADLDKLPAIDGRERNDAATDDEFQTATIVPFSLRSREA
ncbi:flagellar export protein FliJ [Beijerinckia mobilis]|uniref:flagellar export protein FliJ n=1 Tax=Beijerinckia mobilis TaxID=231434 RepID=UPI0005548346|nr:flagellar export protein FliJ [Beijerinckia mobilis]